MYFEMKVGAEKHTMDVNNEHERKGNRYWVWERERERKLAKKVMVTFDWWSNFSFFWWIKNIWKQVNYIHMSWKFLLSGNLTVYWPFTPYPSLCSFLQSTYLTLFNLVQLHRFLYRKCMYTVLYSIMIKSTVGLILKHYIYRIPQLFNAPTLSPFLNWTFIFKNQRFRQVIFVLYHTM